jgi:Flp pilus assembly secretin CpaC
LEFNVRRKLSAIAFIVMMTAPLPLGFAFNRWRAYMTAKFGQQWIFVVAASFLAIAVSSATQAAEQDSVDVTLGYVSPPYKLKTEKPFTTAIVGDTKIIDISPLGNRSIRIVTQAVGDTNILFLDEANVPIMDLSVSVTKKGSNHAEIHDKATISSDTMYQSRGTGGQFVGESTVAEPAPWPTGNSSSIEDAPGGISTTSGQATQ